MVQTRARFAAPVVVGLLVATGLLSFIPGVAAVSETWFLSDTPQGCGLEMVKDAPVEPVEVSFDEEPHIWVADRVSFAAPTTFPPGNWHFRLVFVAIPEVALPGAVDVDIGYCETDGPTSLFTSNHTGSFTLLLPIVDESVSFAGFTVPLGAHLAVKISIPTAPDGEPHVLVTGGAQDAGGTPEDIAISGVSSPENSPSYPAPELLTFALFGVGLATVAGAVHLQRRDSKQGRAR